jgi:hypothetical protein
LHASSGFLSNATSVIIPPFSSFECWGTNDDCFLMDFLLTLQQISEQYYEEINWQSWRNKTGCLSDLRRQL